MEQTKSKPVGVLKSEKTKLLDSPSDMANKAFPATPAPAKQALLSHLVYKNLFPAPVTFGSTLPHLRLRLLK